MKNLDALLIENARLILENAGLQRALELEIDRLGHIAKYVKADNYIDSIGPILTAIDDKVSAAIEMAAEVTDCMQGQNCSDPSCVHASMARRIRNLKEKDMKIIGVDLGRGKDWSTVMIAEVKEDGTIHYHKNCAYGGWPDHDCHQCETCGKKLDKCPNKTAQLNHDNCCAKHGCVERYAVDYKGCPVLSGDKDPVIECGWCFTHNKINENKRT